MTLLVLPTLGQADCCWFGDKPTTLLDSLTIQQNNISIIKIYRTESADSLKNKELVRSFNISNCESCWCPQTTNSKTTDKKIVQTLEWYHISGWNMDDSTHIKCELTHLLDKTGKITTTKVSDWKGPLTEDFAFDKIVYFYANNLLQRADYYPPPELMIKEYRNVPYLSIIYEYE